MLFRPEHFAFLDYFFINISLMVILQKYKINK